MIVQCAALALAGVLLGPGTGTVHAQETAAAEPPEGSTTIPVALPFTGAYRLFGEQLFAGLSASPLGQIATPVPVDTNCSEDGGAEAARTIDADHSDSPYMVGFSCVDALDAAQMTGLLDAKTLVVPMAARTGHPPTTNTEAFGQEIHLAPTPQQEAVTLASYVASQWRDVSLALIDDGTVEGRGFADLVRIELADRGVEPIYVTNYRPQLTNQVALVRLLQRAGATHVIVGGDRFDASVIALGMEIVGYTAQMAGSSAFEPGNAEGDLPPGTVYAALPEISQLATAEDAVADLAEAGLAPDDLVLWGYATGQLVSSWLESANLQDQLADDVAIPTILGPVAIASGDLATNLYTIHEVQPDGSALPIGQVPGQ